MTDQREHGQREPDLYTVLGVDPTASEDELDHAFRALARRLHPDMHSADADSDAFQQVLAAYAVLRNPVARIGYDRHRAATDPTNPAGPNRGAKTTSHRNLPPPTRRPPRSATTSTDQPSPALLIGPPRWWPTALQPVSFLVSDPDMQLRRRDARPG